MVMGIYERDYYRDTRPGLNIRVPRTAIGYIVLVNVVVYLADFLGESFGIGHAISGTLAAHGPGGSGLQAETLTHPWLWWQFLSYGFVHDPKDVFHLVFNMFGLWFLGPAVEMHYGRKEFVRVYLLLLIVGSLVWAIIAKATHQPGSLIGASGAVVGVVILFAVNYPRQTILAFFVVPMPAWVMGVMLVVLDLWGALVRAHAGGAALGEASQVAYTVHLAGAAFAFLYFQQQWNLGRFFDGRFSLRRLTHRPRLRVYEDDEQENTSDSKLTEEVDRILAKISSQGEASLSRKERRTLENASREYQRRRRG
jgi:membrane associated rhomboid family serine protease